MAIMEFPYILRRRRCGTSDIGYSNKCMPPERQKLSITPLEAFSDSNPKTLEVDCRFCNEPEVCRALEGSSLPSRAGASGSHHLPWALPRVLQPIPKIKRDGRSV